MITIKLKRGRIFFWSNYLNRMNILNERIYFWSWSNVHINENIILFLAMILQREPTRKQKIQKEWGLKCQFGNDKCIWCKKMCLNFAKRYNLQYNSNSICTQVINLPRRYLSFCDKNNLIIYLIILLYSFVFTWTYKKL